MLRAGHERCFAEWLSFNLRQQAADLHLHFCSVACAEGKIAATWLRLESFRQFVPENATGAEKRLFLCDMNAILQGYFVACDTFTSPSVASIDSPRKSVFLLSTLSGRECQVLRLIGKGNTTKEIANDLSLSCHTVANHRKNICFKLRAHSTAELVCLGIE